MRNKPTNSFWTDEQWEAIVHEGENILVSAGAGSGKTAVLSERVIEKLRNGVHIDELIILTFTKAAASEMKERIQKKIQKEVNKGIKLEEELRRIELAKITTFDSFCMDLVKKYGYLLGVPQSIQIVDDIVIESKKDELLHTVFNQLLEMEDESFMDFLADFTVKDPSQMKKVVKRLYEQMAMVPDLDQYLTTYQNSYVTEKFQESLWADYEAMVMKELDGFKEIIHDGPLFSDDKIISHFDEVKSQLRFVLSATTYETLYQATSAVTSFKRFPTSKSIDELEKQKYRHYFDEVKAIYAEMTPLILYKDRDEALEELKLSQENGLVLLKVLVAYHQALMDYKRTHHAYGFLDIEKLAIRILKEHTDVCEHIRQTTNEIMIDEYQDTNDLQEYLVHLIASDNVYMVGDLKQSIYGFRNANPSLFLEKYNLYARGVGGKKIDLSLNFRSREEVLTDINEVFYKIFDERIGGIDYDESQALMYGNRNYDLFKERNYGLEFYAYDEKLVKETEKTASFEAKWIVSDILRKINEGYEIFDKDTKEKRKVTFEDFVILTATKSNYEAYLEIFESYQVPLAIHKDESFFYSDEMYVLKNIVSLIYCLSDYEYQKIHYKHAFYSVMRSFVCKFEDEAISGELHRHPNLSGAKERFSSPFYDWYLKLYNLHIYSKEHGISELLLEIYRQFDFYQKSTETDSPASMHLKLDTLYEKTRQLEDAHYVLEDYVAYFNDLVRQNLDINFGMNTKMVSGKVNMMTIHKSKGLEFHIVYFPEVNKSFNKEDLKSPYLFTQKYGLITPLFKEGLKESFVKTLYKSDYQIDAISEQLRVLYVALTRIKELGIIVMPQKEQELTSISSLVPTRIREKYSKFMSMYYSMIGASKFIVQPAKIEEVMSDEKSLPETRKPHKIEFKELNYQSSEKKYVRFSKTIQSLLSKKEQEAIRLGNDLHKVLEFVDLKNPDLSSLNPLEKEVISKLSQQEFMKNVKNPTYYHEYEFIADGQLGVIDLLIDDEEILIVDFKLKALDDDAYVKQLKAYEKYIQSVSSKPIRCYLYSLLTGEVKQL